LPYEIIAEEFIRGQWNDMKLVVPVMLLIDTAPALGFDCSNIVSCDDMCAVSRVSLQRIPAPLA